MSGENIVLSIMAIALSALSLGIGYYVLLEVIDVIRELAQSLRERRSRPFSQMPRSPDDTVPLPVVTPYNDKKIVKRLIDYLKTGSDKPTT